MRELPEAAELQSSTDLWCCPFRAAEYFICTRERLPAGTGRKDRVNTMPKRGKKYRSSTEGLDRAKVYELDEGLETALKSKYAKFDESVDIAIKLGVDPRHADQMVRSSVMLPHGTGTRGASFVASSRLDGKPHHTDRPASMPAPGPRNAPARSPEWSPLLC